ncbi:MAG: TetR/AcrR family transcriptional regulator [Oceanococcaceae bacterium]
MPPKTAEKSRKRPYLRKDARRRQLLETAAEIVEAEGWAALSMSALAEKGQTSRQLVYQHFPNLDSLLSRTAWHIFNDTIEGTRDAIASHPHSLQDAIRSAEAVSLDLSPGRGDALWQLLAGGSGSPELERVGQGVRELILQTWLPSVKKDLGLEGPQARLTAWALIMAFWGAWQMIREGQVGREEGMETFNRMLSRLTEAPLAPPAEGPHDAH